MIESEFIEALPSRVKSLTSHLEETDYINAASDAQDELWSFPVTSGFRIRWLFKRAVRHLFFYLATGSAHRFQVDGYRLQQRFENYKKMYESMDAEFEAAKEKDPDLFPVEVDEAVDKRQMFGFKIDAGFQYDDSGNETTYGTSNSINVTPDGTE